MHQAKKPKKKKKIEAKKVFENQTEIQSHKI